MPSNKLVATKRSEFGKGAARRTRRQGLIPAVLYGHGTEPLHIALPDHDTFLIIRHNRNALIELDIEGEDRLALVKDIQLNPVLRVIEHLDLVMVRRGEKVTVSIPVTTEGESFSGTIASVEMMELEIEAPATSIPENVVVNIDGLEDGTVIRVSDLALPEDVTTSVDPEAAVIVISTPRAEEPEDEETGTAEPAAAPAAEESAE